MPRDPQHAAAQSWERAKLLARVAGIKPGIARSYLATVPIDTQIALSNTKSKNSHLLQEHLAKIAQFEPPIRMTKKRQGFEIRPSETPENHIPSTRRSLGDPHKAPRAGAPTHNTNGYTTLLALKDFCNTHGGIEKVQEELNTLREVQF